METLRKETVFNREDERVVRRRLVAKLGSSTVCDATGAVRVDLLHSLAAQTEALKQNKVDTIFVSSGAVAVGRLVASENADKKITDKKLLSNIGQSWLSAAWNKAFYPTPVAQLLFTDEELKNASYIKSQIEAAIRYGVVPVINSSNPETNNDFASTQIAHAVDADTLALLTSTNGVLKDEHPISLVTNWADLEGAITEDISSLGNGGMKPKCGAALGFIQKSKKGKAIIAHGNTPNILHRIADMDQAGTWFVQA